MDKLFSLDERLKMCASLVRKSARLVDVGSDHAYLPVWLLNQGKISFAIASDINEKPLENGRLTAEKYGAENIKFRLGSGLDAIDKSDNITDVVIAGMGGEVISEIILKSPLTRNENLNIILQPMTKSGELISFLYENGFEIYKQKCVISKGKCYTVMAVRYTSQKIEISDIFPYTGKLDLNDEVNLRFINAHIKHLENKSRGDNSLIPLVKKLKNIIKNN